MTAPAQPGSDRSAETSKGSRGSKAKTVRRPLSVRRTVVDLVAVALLMGAGLVGWWPSFAGGSFLPAAIGGVVLGLGIALLCAWRGWGVLATAGLTLLVYYLFGGALALPQTTLFGVVPTGQTLGALSAGAITSWKAMLTTVAPVAVADGYALVPFLAALVFGVVAAALALRLRRAAWALIPAAAHLMLVIAMGVPAPAAPIAQGVAFALVAVAWLALRGTGEQTDAAVSVAADGTHSTALRRRRILAGAAVLVVAGLAGTGVATATTLAEPRHVFRDVVLPPFDVHQYASPLQSYRGYVKDHRKDTLFTVKGLPEGARIRVGTMDAFNGVVYDVSDKGVGSSGAFSPIRDNMSADATGSSATLDITMDAYKGVWLPDAGQVSRIAFAGSDADALRRGTYYNESTGTAVATSKLRKGDTYTVDTTIPRTWTDKQLEGLDFGTVAMPKSAEAPEKLAALASDTVADAKTPIAQVRALVKKFSEEGFFSHGLEGEALSRAGHTEERISTLIGGQQMVGDDEQYAVAMALAARSLGIPVRVVMGFYPDKGQKGTFSANGDNLHAWVEVNFEKAGWVAFDPTPPKDKVPQDQITKPKVVPKPQVLQPPPPPQDPVELPPSVPDQRGNQDGPSDLLGILGAVLAIGGSVLLVLAILASPFIVIGAWKAARRRKRRAAALAADRISGGWDELTDRAVDYGARLPVGATRAEEAQTVATSLTVPAVTTLADQADAQVFGPSEPTAEDVDAFWREVDGIVAGLGKEASWRRRMLARLSLRSLLGGTRLSTGVQGLRDAAAERIRRPQSGSGASAAAPGTIENTAGRQSGTRAARPGSESENS
ncbi:transglutaminase-like domain-containing protein [Microbacterium azadirachtae]|uniref:transglutaminase family protein n=1 Tax=Microbacterium azadirachtae TaxID=582680 RepID=UPI0021D49568|nr:transglutaminase domain-containing protein [Microbacterium azadirachtae]UXW86326.1 transglutaminase-like domain-containing protein [Microbacterium azadirachtae]